jgi:hypothetical protein
MRWREGLQKWERGGRTGVLGLIRLIYLRMCITTNYKRAGETNIQNWGRTGVTLVQPNPEVLGSAEPWLVRLASNFFLGPLIPKLSTKNDNFTRFKHALDEIIMVHSRLIQ